MNILLYRPLIASMGAANHEQPIPRVLSVVGVYCWTDYNRLDRSTTLVAGAFSDDVILYWYPIFGSVLTSFMISIKFMSGIRFCWTFRSLKVQSLKCSRER